MIIKTDTPVKTDSYPRQKQVHKSQTDIFCETYSQKKEKEENLDWYKIRTRHSNRFSKKKC